MHVALPHIPFPLWRLPLAGFLRIMVPLFRMITGHPIRRYSELSPHLWVGGQYYRHGWKWMQRSGISAILNLRRDHDDRQLSRIPQRYLWLPTTDNTPPTMEDLQQGVDFIATEVQSGGTVYVHCRAGVGRAPTLVACYLVSTGMKPAEAWDAIKDVRPFIFPTRAQVGQVEQFYRCHV